MPTKSAPAKSRKPRIELEKTRRGWIFRFVASNSRMIDPRQPYSRQIDARDAIKIMQQSADWDIVVVKPSANRKGAKYGRRH